VDVPEYIAALRAEGALLARAAGQAGPDAPVPACPGWRVRDLVRHTGSVHRWATGYVAGQRETPVPGPSEEEMVRSGPDSDQDLLGWFLDGHERLVTALEHADPGMTCWTFLPSPSPLAFWARRQAHETAIHRVDAQLAAGVASPGGPGDFTPGLAADGIDELVMGFGRRRSKRGLRSDPPSWLAVHARPGSGHPANAGEDREGEESGGHADWVIRMGTDSAAVARGAVPPDDAPDGTGCDLTGPAEALYLLLWNRGGADGLELRGDPRGLGVWQEQVRVRW
jgi:uncharacterized protein (TIGR03083 family)